VTVRVNGFQSAPRPCGRGDLAQLAKDNQTKAFQSAPNFCQNLLQDSVSIRAPALRPGRPGRHGGQRREICFNPRPGLATGATLLLANVRRHHLRFQSAPRSCDRGDLKLTVVLLAFASFNPRPGLATGATPNRSKPSAIAITFQSAPRSCDRGDCGSSNWRSRKCFVAHFRQPVSFSPSSGWFNVKEQLEKFAFIGFSFGRETPASQPSHMVRGSEIIKLAVR
jgi:hypothetical protein